MQTVLMLLLLASLSVNVMLMLYWSRREDRAKAVYFTMLNILLSYYVLGYLVGLLCQDVETSMVALHVCNAGIPLIGPFFLFTILSLFQPGALKRWVLPAALVYGLVMFTVILFNDRHWLYYSSITMVSDGAGTLYPQMGHGPLYIAQQLVSVGSALLAYGVLFRFYVRGTRKSRGQMRLVVVGSSMALLANALNFSGILPAGLDPTPITMTVALVFFAMSLQRYKLLDLLPMARSSAVEGMEDAMIVLDMERGYQYSNKAAQAIFPGLGQLHGTELITAISDWPDELIRQTTPGEVVFFKEDAQGQARQYRAHVRSIGSSEADAFIGWSYVMRDITDVTRMLQQLEELATTDPLTGIYNRRQFLTMVNHEMEVAARLWLNMSLIMYDLDHFKDVNDTYGHIAGDQVLCQVANAIKSQLRPYDIFARYGGEEFVVFTTFTEEIDLRAFAERLRAAVEKAEVVYEGRKIHVTASFGAVRIKPKTEFNDAMRAVDVATYKAKTNGRNQVVVVDIEGNELRQDPASL